MLPGRRYSIASIVWILKKRRWVFLAPFIFCAIISAGVARVLPDRYRASTLILVVPQRVPENYVRPAVDESIEQRLLTISPQILSESRLERIMRELDLYPKQRLQKRALQQVIEGMRNDIDVEIIKGDLFRVTYSGDSPFKVMQVTQRLASLFVEENLKDREQLAVGTNQFLESQLEDARRRLEDQEHRLQEYRQTHSGELPSQLAANLSVLQGANLQLQALEESLARDRDRRIEVDRALQDLQRIEPPPPQTEVPARSAESTDKRSAGDPLDLAVVGSRLVQLEIAKQRLEAMRRRYTDDHPDVIRAKRLIAELEKTVGDDLVEQGTSAPDAATITRLARAAQVREQLTALDRDIARKAGEQTRLKAVIATYQARVESQPARESELISLTRDYDTLRGTYQNLLAKREESGIAANLERQQVSQQFRTLDPARLPERPYSPNRLVIQLAGAAFGLFLGFGLAAMLEFRDQSFRTASEVVEMLSLPVLAMVPPIVTRYEQRRFNQRLALSVGVVVLSVLVAVGIYGVRNRWW